MVRSVRDAEDIPFCNASLALTEKELHFCKGFPSACSMCVTLGEIVIASSS